MKSTRLLPLLFIALTLFGAHFSTARADDLDDGISKPTDDAIAPADTLGEPDKNIKFIITKAKSQAGGGQQSGGASGGNMNSVIVGPGSNIKGDVIIIDQSKGNKTQVVE